jgi:8-oxo-dGTP pyrophosphatase MutT (NUDIX family)
VAELVERVDEADRVLGVVPRGEAVANGWMIRIATTVCRDDRGRYLVYRRPDDAPWFPGYYEVSFGGAVNPDESYAAAAARELAEELGVRSPVRYLFKYLCRGSAGTYWLGVHEALIDTAILPARQEIAWHGWMTETELHDAVQRLPFIPDGQDAWRRYRAAASVGTPPRTDLRAPAEDVNLFEAGA